MIFVWLLAHILSVVNMVSEIPSKLYSIIILFCTAGIGFPCSCSALLHAVLGDIIGWCGGPVLVGVVEFVKADAAVIWGVTHNSHKTS